jgi:HD-like signal output (HDOD) protein
VILKRFADKLRGLFRSHARPRRDEAAELAARLENNVLALVGNMPALPDTATRAMALADDPGARVADLVGLIEADVAIATALLRTANSAFYSGGAPATKLSQAVVRLGGSQCKNLIVAVSMKTLIWQMAGDEKARCEALWHHGYLTACLCSQVARAFRLLFDGAEFSAGLLHDLGRVLLLLADPECFARAGAMDFHEEPGLLARERAAIGIDHCALGAWFGEQSQLPDTLIQAMRFHHEPESADPPSTLVDLVATADHMANHLQRGEPIETYDPQGNVGLAYLWGRWPEARRERLLDEIPSLMEEALAAAAREQTAACA